APAARVRRDHRRPAGQAVRARGRRRPHAGAPRRGPHDRRDAVVEPGDRGLRDPPRRARSAGRRGPGRHGPGRHAVQVGVAVKVGVVTFPGSLDDGDALRAVRLAGAEAVALWHADHDLQGVDALVLPGGFSYGDYLRCGAIARFAPVMDQVVDAAVAGMP